MRRISALLVALLMMLAGCLGDDGDDGGSDGDGDGTGGDNGDNGDEEPRENVTVSITWSGTYSPVEGVNGEYSTDPIRVPANSTVILTFTNEDPAFGHDFVVEGIEGASTKVLDACTPDMSDCPSEEIIFDVGAPQDVKFYCNVGDHRDNGMEGDFIVE